MRLHLGCGRTILPGWVNMDIQPLDGVDAVADFDDCEHTPLPLPDNCVAEFMANHLIEHLAHPLPFMQELHRVALPGAKAVFRCPFGTSSDAFEDPTHKRAYFPASFMYFGQPTYFAADYGYRGDWEMVMATLTLERARFEGRSEPEIWEAVRTLNNMVLQLCVELKAVKPIRPPNRELMRPVPAQLAFV